ncbi:hypothetical protein SNE40_018665 [Patella caerulea]|uniref:Uncharacterized protein n=2 Tax=Patella caerulea TaxID=87958 RepID=A0AAN8P8B5_PATCE
MNINFVIVLLLVTMDIVFINCNPKDEITNSACYGTFNNFLDLECEWREKIKIHKVYQGAKPTALECPYPTDQNSFKEECCVPAEEDCMFEIQTGETNSYESLCNGKSTCKLLTMWSGTTGLCDPKKFNSHTNFMKITYSCLSDHITKLTTTIKTTTTTTPLKTYITPKTMTARPNPRIIKDNTTTTSSTTNNKPTESTTPVNAAGSATRASTISVTGYQIPNENPLSPSTKANKKDDNSFAFTTGMMGGMAAAIIGLMLTIFGFLFYWGRKRRHMSMVKPQTSVWDFLLSQNINFRPFRRGGYDNFNSHRSSISSDGEANSPVTRKSGWTPNIAVETGSVNEPTTSDDNCSIVDVHRNGHV